jgi:hypothetical protein
VRLVQADKVSAWEAQEEAVESIRQENEIQLDRFVQSLKRPMTPEERVVFMRARAGLDVPENNPLGLRPLSAAIPKRRCDVYLGLCVTCAVLWLVSSTHHTLVNITADSTTATISCTWRCSFNTVQMKKCAPRMVESTDKQMSESSVAFSGPCHAEEQICRNHWQLLVLRFEFSFHQTGAMPSLVARGEHTTIRFTSISSTVN